MNPELSQPAFELDCLVSDASLGEIGAIQPGPASHRTAVDRMLQRLSRLCEGRDQLP